MIEKNDDMYILKKTNPKVREILSACIGVISARYLNQDIQVTIAKYTKKRSDLQNRYFHGWILRAQIMRKLNDAGITYTNAYNEKCEYDVEILKVLFKDDYFLDQIEEPEIIMVDGKEIKKERHPSLWNTAKFSAYCDLVSDAAQIRWDITVEPPSGGQWYTYYKELGLC